MPSVCAHMVVAKIISKKLNINSDEFIKGNLLPDIIDDNDSHHKIVSGNYMVPDIDYFACKIDYSDSLQIGYLTHLLLDKHYLNNYIKTLYPNANIFIDRIIYGDYNIINGFLIDRFNLDIGELEQVLSKYDCKIIEEKLKYNIECLKQKKNGSLKYLEPENFSQFLLDISSVIIKELNLYAYKYSKLCICT